MRYLIALLFLVSAAAAADAVRKSTSPDGKWRVLVEPSGEKAHYRVADSSMQLSRVTFPSDYWHVKDCLGSRIVWREDSNYFVIEEAVSGIHQAFVVAHKTLDGFEELPFDRNKVMDSTKLSWHHGAVRFDGWLPNNRLAVTVYGDLDGSRADFECSFVLDLEHGLQVLSHRVIKPE